VVYGAASSDEDTDVEQAGTVGGTEAPPTDDQARRATARRMWVRLEVLHTPVYFAPSIAAAQKTLGLRGRMMSYTASRVAPMGPIGPELATAVLYNFSPQLVATALPDAWDIASPAEVLDTVQTAMGDLLDEVLDGLDVEVARAAELARQAALLHPTVGRPLAAAWSSVPLSDRPSVALWQATTRIRESRGDGHVAELVDAQLDGVEAHLMLAGDSVKLRERMGPMRGITDPVWDAAVTRLRGRGLLADDGAMTAAGERLRRRIEDDTDRLAAPPWVALGEQATAQLDEVLAPLIQRVVAAGVLPAFVTRRLGA
jgi:hypothetical protein